MQPSLAAQSFRWLLVYFGFAVVIHLIDHTFPDLFPGWFRDFGFQMFLLFALLFLFKQGWRPKLSCSWLSLTLTVGGLCLYVLFLWLLNGLAMLSGVEATPMHRDASIQQLMLLLMLAPILEELFFRDYLLRAFYWQMNRFGRAVFFSSGFFMLAHMSLYPGAFVLGVINALLYASLRSVWPAVVFHVVSNLSLFFLPAYFPHLYRALERLNILTVFYQ